MHHCHQIQHRMHDFHVGVGTEILGAIAHRISGRKHFGEALGCNPNIRIGFIVFEGDVVPRLKLLDQTVFQEQGIHLGIHHREFNPLNFAHEDGRFAVFVMLLREVTADAFFEVFGMQLLR